MVFKSICVCMFIILMIPIQAFSEIGLPFATSWESGNWSEWNGTRQESPGAFTVGQYGARTGSYCARAIHYMGANNDNYADFYFADH